MLTFALTLQKLSGQNCKNQITDIKLFLYSLSVFFTIVSTCPPQNLNP